MVQGEAGRQLGMDLPEHRVLKAKGEILRDGESTGFFLL